MTEPVGSKAPTIQGEEGSSMKRRSQSDIVIPCHSQSYPLAQTRYSKLKNACKILQKSRTT